MDGKTINNGLTFNCQYYKNITYCIATEIYDSQHKYLEIDAQLQTICKQCPLAFKLFCFVVDLTSIFLYYHVGF